MATNEDDQQQQPSPKDNIKFDSDHIELSHSITVEPPLDAAKAGGGIILDTRGLVGQGCLHLAADGHV